MKTSTVSSLGYLDSERLALIPPELWKHHEFCFFLHDRVAALLVEYEMSGSHNLVIDAFQKAAKEQNVDLAGTDILQFLKQHNLVDEYRHHIASHLVLALTSDMLHFLYEALSCFEKRKFSVAFSLLRKPLKENLLFLCWLLADETDFIKRFESKNYQTLNNIKKDKQLEILSGAIQKLATSEAFEADLIWGKIYSKTQLTSLEPLWQRATHLITSQGDLLATEDYDINFIFEGHVSNEHFDSLYDKLPYLLIFLTQVALACFESVLSLNKKTVSHLIVSTMGCYEALFLKSNTQPLGKLLNNALKPFLKCIHCSAPIRINRSNAPTMYITEQLDCKSCGLMSTFPLYWLFCSANITIYKDAHTP